MKKEKDIVKFFERYSEQMLPEDGAQFMEKLKQNMDLLPVPSAFNKVDQEMSKEYAEWVLAKLKKDYKRTKREVVISCLFACMTIVAVLLVVYSLGIFEINRMVSLGVWAVVALVLIGLLYNLLPLRTRDLF